MLDMQAMEAFNQYAQNGELHLSAFARMVVDSGFDPVLIELFSRECDSSRSLSKPDFIKHVSPHVCFGQFEYSKPSSLQLQQFQTFLKENEIESGIGVIQFHQIVSTLRLDELLSEQLFQIF